MNIIAPTKVLIPLLLTSLFVVPATGGEATGVPPKVLELDRNAIAEPVGRDIDGKTWNDTSQTTGQPITGYELSCNVEGNKVGMCGGCGDGDEQSAEPPGLKVSKDFAAILNNSIAKCVAAACGLLPGEPIMGAKVHGCGFQDRKTASGNISNHASANAIDLTKITCPDGKAISFDLTGGSDSLGGAVNSSPTAVSGTPTATANIPRCSHSPPSDGYNSFNQCWTEVLTIACEEGYGGALTAANTQPTGRTKPDSKLCHHQDHVHFSTCPGSGI